MEIEVSKSPRSPLPLIVSSLVINGRLLHVSHREHVVSIALFRLGLLGSSPFANEDTRLFGWS